MELRISSTLDLQVLAEAVGPDPMMPDTDPNHGYLPRELLRALRDDLVAECDGELFEDVVDNERLFQRLADPYVLQNWQARGQR